jgi:hypothetical protein
MDRARKVAFLFITFLFLGLLLHESIHLYRFGHVVPLGLHADVYVTTSADVLGVDGTARIYDARLTNYGILPTTIVVCGYSVSGAPATAVNYVVERWDRQSGKWIFVPEWDFYGSRLFCRPVFEVTDEHLAQLRLWPGQSIRVGGGTPGQMSGFHIGDDGRFTVFLSADGNRRNALSTSTFRVDQQVRNNGVPLRFTR